MIQTITLLSWKLILLLVIASALIWFIYSRKKINRLQQERNTLLQEKEATIGFVQNVGEDGLKNICDHLVYLGINDGGPIYDKLKPIFKNYLILGNHEFSIDKIHSKKSRFIALDATDNSFYSNALHDHDLMEIDLYFEKSKGQSNSHDCNSAFGKSLKNWLK